MPIEISEVHNGQLKALEHLLLLYAHDLSEFDSIEPDENGMYALDKWLASCAGTCRFLVQLRGRPAGLMFVSRSDQGNHVQDLFVLRCYRGLGLGEEAVLRAVRLAPGRWSAQVSIGNVGGLAFWRHVLRRHAGRNYRETASTCGSAHIFEFQSDGSEIVRV